MTALFWWGVVIGGGLSVVLYRRIWIGPQLTTAEQWKRLLEKKAA